MHTLKYPKEQLMLAKHRFECFGRAVNERYIAVDNIPFRSLEQLVASYPILTNHLDALAILVNFMLVGDAFWVITDIDNFRQDYLTLYRREGSLNGCKWSHPYGQLDLSTLENPKITDGKFCFFAICAINELPYAASCSYPFSSTSLSPKYELLSL